jgi:hypothetical protein
MQVVEESEKLINENEPKPEKARDLDVAKKGIELFFGEKERRFMESAGKELVHGVLKESFLLFRIDLGRTKTHKLYGEAKKKFWLDPIEIFGRINVEVGDPEYMSKGGIIKKGLGKITAEVYNSHLDEMKATLKIGDFMYHKGHYYEIIDDGASNISNEHAFGGDKLFFVTIKGVRVKDDAFKAR